MCQCAAVSDLLNHHITSKSDLDERLPCVRQEEARFLQPSDRPSGRGCVASHAQPGLMSAGPPPSAYIRVSNYKTSTRPLPCRGCRRGPPGGRERACQACGCPSNPTWCVCSLCLRSSPIAAAWSIVSTRLPSSHSAPPGSGSVYRVRRSTGRGFVSNRHRLL